MPNYWPKNMSHTNITAEARQDIMLNERFRQIEARIKTLEEKK